MTPASLLIVILLCGAAALDTLADTLNLRHLKAELPEEFRGTYDAEKYRVSQRYLRDNVRADALRRTILLAATLAFIFGGGFGAVDRLAVKVTHGPILAGLIFVGVLSLLRAALQLPFSLHHTFVIEERYGFNRSTARVFLGDLIKGTILSVVIGAPIFAGIQWFFEKQGPGAWLSCWAALTAVQLLLVFLAPVVLMPLFNKFSPLADGPLKQAIERYAHSESFRIQGVYTMDGSKRSSKSNAFFTGFGPFRKLALFDTLVEQQSVEELTAVVAHEVGHFKRGHILKGLGLSIAATGLMLYVMSRFLGNEALLQAFRVDHLSVYASLVFISILYGPIWRPLSVLTHWLSRRNEYQADDYSALTYGKPEQLISALKKLSRDNLSNLSPHPLKVWLDYTHPPVLERIKHLRHLRTFGSRP